MKVSVPAILTVMVLAVFVCLGTSHALLNVYEDMSITEGDVYDSVQVYESAVISMTGGDIIGLGAHDFSTVNMSGGHIAVLGSDYESSSMLNLNGQSCVDSALIRGASKLSIYDGNVGSIEMFNSATLRLTGGVISDYLGVVWDECLVHIYGYDFSYEPLGGDYNGGLLTGFWPDSSAFSISLRDFGDPPPVLPSDFTYSHIIFHEVPEPATILLFVLVAVALRRRR